MDCISDCKAQNLSNHSWAIGIDLGGTKIDIAAVDSSGKLHHQKIIHTAVSGGAEAIENQLVESILELYQAFSFPPSGIGIGIAAQVNSKTGLVLFAPNLFWKNWPLSDRLQAKLSSRLKEGVGIPKIILENDVRAATIGEWYFGNGINSSDFICVFVGTGIGGGVVSEGKLIKGFNNSAGEIGHIIVDPNGPPCTCGSFGCLEAFAGGWAIAKNARLLLESLDIKQRQESYLFQLVNEKIDQIDAVAVIKASKQNDVISMKVLDGAKKALIAGGISIVNAFNPQKLIFGGGILRGLPKIVDWVREGIDQRALNSAKSKLEVIEAKLKENAGVIGAAINVLKNYC